MMCAVEGEGMPVFKSPMEHGNLFLILDIEFPTEIDEAAAKSLRSALPPPLHNSDVQDDNQEYDVHELKVFDPVESYEKTSYNLAGDATQEEEREAGAQGVQCANQ